jgi:hypothetical protein
VRIHDILRPPSAATMTQLRRAQGIVRSPANSLVIVGRYPFPGRRLEGMLQRIEAVDRDVRDSSRTYLDLYAFKNIRAMTSRDANVDIYTGSFLNILSLIKILRQARKIYVHSIYFYALILLPIFLIGKNTQIILDLHGTVPEELRYEGRKWLARLMSIVEKFAFRRISMAVCVTRQMEAYYRNKYPNSSASFLYMPIFTSQVCQPADKVAVNRLRCELGIPSEALVFVYSGGLQAWQNIDLMLALVKNINKKPNNWFIFLTNQTDLMEIKISNKFHIIPENFIITHVEPTQLRNYYELAHFGFILRDEHILNRVANPTKLVEYMFFGIRPIVSYELIGDFFENGYEYVLADALDDIYKFQGKSDKNKTIIRSMLKNFNSAKISEHMIYL